MRAKIIFLICIFFVLNACGGKKEVKVISSESRIFTEAVSLVDSIKDLYIKKDFPPIAEKATPGGYKDIIDSIKHFDSVELTFTPRYAEIEQTKVYLNVAWKGTWYVGRDAFRERGMAVFLLEGRPLRLSKIIRGNPFRYPER